MAEYRRCRGVGGGFLPVKMAKMVTVNQVNFAVWCFFRNFALEE